MRDATHFGVCHSTNCSLGWRFCLRLRMRRNRRSGNSHDLLREFVNSIMNNLFMTVLLGCLNCFSCGITNKPNYETLVDHACSLELAMVAPLTPLSHCRCHRCHVGWLQTQSITSSYCRRHQILVIRIPYSVQQSSCAVPFNFWFFFARGRGWCFWRRCTLRLSV